MPEYLNTRRGDTIQLAVVVQVASYKYFTTHVLYNMYA